MFGLIPNPTQMSIPFKKVSSFGDLLQPKSGGDDATSQSDSQGTKPPPTSPVKAPAADVKAADRGIIRKGLVSSDPAIKQLIEARNIRGLVHFTPMLNVPSILERGLMPRVQLEQLRARGEAQFDYSDHHRFDGKESNCLSIAFPNGEMFYRKRKEHPQWKWVVLVFHPEEILSHPSTTFTVSNASRGGVDQAAGAEGLQQVFGDSPAYWHCPRDRQAEVRVPRVIGTDLINVICCHTAEDVWAVRALAAGARCQAGEAGLWQGRVELGASYFMNLKPPKYRDCPFS